MTNAAIVVNKNFIVKKKEEKKDCTARLLYYTISWRAIWRVKCKSQDKCLIAIRWIETSVDLICYDPIFLFFDESDPLIYRSKKVVKTLMRMSSRDEQTRWIETDK